MLIIGLNAFHGDSSACILRDGKLVAAVQEDRLRGVKHWAGFPSNSIRHCLQKAKANLSDVDILAVNYNGASNVWRKLLYGCAAPRSFPAVAGMICAQASRRPIPKLIQQYFDGEKFAGQVVGIDHQLSHLSSAFHVSPFDRATVLSVDGFGDFSSTAWGIGHGSGIRVEGRIWFPHSLGTFYQAMTQYLGFSDFGDEYKVMRLSGHGEPSYLPRMRNIVQVLENGGFQLNLAYFNHHRKGLPEQWDGEAPAVETLFTRNLEDLLGPRRTPEKPLNRRHRDIARSVQAMYEEAFFNLLNHLQKSHESDSIALAGSCAMNAVANGKIRQRTSYKHIYVQSAEGDSGGAIGAAYIAWHKNGESPALQNGPRLLEA